MGEASKHRGPSNQETLSQKTTTSQTYANATFVPKKDQAIIVDSVEGCTIDDYLDGIELLMDISNIKFMSKISGGRVCIYLANKSMVNELSNKQVQVQNNTLTIRPLLEKNKRVVISNASPSIPNEILIQALKNKGIGIVSQMHYIRASTSKPGRSHIYSFRRQVYIKEKNEHLLPENLQITFEDTPHWIYLSTESTHCFVCKQKGHIAKVCPEFQDTAIQQQIQPLQDNNDCINPEQLNSHSEITTAIENKRVPLNRLPESTSSESSFPVQPTDATENSQIPTTAAVRISKPKDPTFQKPLAKKTKLEEDKDKQSEQNADIEICLLPAKQIIEENPNQHVLGYDNFKAFIKNSYGQRNVKAIADEFTKETTRLYEMLEIIHPLIINKRLKARIIRIKNKLLSQNMNETDSDGSQSSTSTI